MKTPTTELDIFALLYVMPQRTLELTVDCCALIYGQGAVSVAAAWEMYDDAIEREAPRDEIEELYKLCGVVEAHAQDAYEKLNAAKAALLARMN